MLKLIATVVFVSLCSAHIGYGWRGRHWQNLRRFRNGGKTGFWQCRHCLHAGILRLFSHGVCQRFVLEVACYSRVTVGVDDFKDNVDAAQSLSQQGVWIESNGSDKRIQLVRRDLSGLVLRGSGSLPSWG